MNPFFSTTDLTIDTDFDDISYDDLIIELISVSVE